MLRWTLALLCLCCPTAAPWAQTDPQADATHALVTAMAKVGYATAPTFSPDGRQVAFLTNLSGSPQVWRIPVTGGYPQMVTSLDDPVQAVAWSPAGDWLAIQVAPGGGLNSQVYVVRPDGTGLRRLTEGGKSNNWLGDWTADGRFIAISSNRGSPDAMDSYYLSPAGEFRRVARNKGIGEIADTTADGRFALVSRLVSRGSNDLYLIDTTSDRELLLTKHTGPGNFSGVLSPDGKTVWVGSDLDRDLVAFGKITHAGGKASRIEVIASRQDAELENLAIDDEGRTIALSWNLAGRNELELYDVASGSRRRVEALPSETVADLEFSPDGSKLVISASGAADPRDLYVVDTAAARVVARLTTSPHAGVDLASLVRPELVRYAAHDGLELTGWLYRAKVARGPGPVVMSYHGGPEGQERPVFRGDYQALLSRGISVLAPNVRGSSGFGKRFVNLDNGALRVDAVRDIKATIDWLVNSGIADPKKIGIMGGSYGGYMVMAGLTEYPTEIAAGANLFGVVNFATFFANSEPWMAAISTIEYGDPVTQADMLRNLSPLTRIDRVVAPTLVLHGANDTNVPVIEAEQVVENLRKRGVPVEYILFPDEGHGWRKTTNRVRSTVAIVDWFSKYLQ
jgi:dipeptidyl aminopeptidase/acylaminoacyl peptidase